MVAPTPNDVFSTLAATKVQPDQVEMPSSELNSGWNTKKNTTTSGVDVTGCAHSWHRCGSWRRPLDIGRAKQLRMLWAVCRPA